jgi:UDP-glucose 4-epimerase
VYGNREKLIHSESDTYVDECESPYTASKVGGEAMVKSYGNCYDMSTTILRFSNVFGRYDVSDRVVPLFIAKADAGETLTVFGDNKVLDFTYLDDCINGIFKTVDNHHLASGETYNIASGSGASLVALAEEIIESTGSNSDIVIEATRTGEVGRFVADIDKAAKVLGYEPQHSLADGIAATTDWYADRPDLYREVLN